LSSFPPSFLSVDSGFSFPLYLVFPPAAFTFCQASAFPLVISFRLQVFFIIFFAFSSGGFVFPSGFAFWNEAKSKRRQKRRQNSREAAWHGPGQELANLLPHPATTATTTIATVGPSCAFAAGICLTSTSKAPTAPASPASPRLLLLLLLLLLMQLQLLLMLMLLALLLVLVLVLVAVAAAVTADLL